MVGFLSAMWGAAAAAIIGASPGGSVMLMPSFDPDYGIGRAARAVPKSKRTVAHDRRRAAKRRARLRAKRLGQA